MKLWLSRMRDGRYTLTMMRPRLCRLKATKERDFYIEPGDPVGMLRAICALGVEMINPACKLEPLTMRRVDVKMEPLEK